MVSSSASGALSAGSHASRMSGVCRIAVFSLHWFHNGVVQVYNEIFVDLIFVWGTAIGYAIGSLVVASSLSSTIL